MINDFFQKNKSMIVAADMGFGKTRCVLMVLLILYYNNIIKHFIIISKTQIIDQFINELEDICSEEKMNINVPSIYCFHKLIGKKKIENFTKFTKKGGFFFSTFSSMKNLKDNFISLINHEFFLCVDESQYLKSNSNLFMANIFKLSQSNYCKNKKIFSTATLFNESIKRCFNQMKIFLGETPTFKTIEELKEFLKHYIIRRKVKKKKKLFYYLLIINQSPLQSLFYEKYLKEKKINDTIDENDKWLGLTVQQGKNHISSKQIIDESINSVDIFYSNNSKDENLMKIFQTLIYKDGKFPYLYEDFNQKLFIAIDFIKSVVEEKKENGVVIVNSLVFFNFLEKSIKFLSVMKEYEFLKEVFISVNGSEKPKDKSFKITFFQKLKTGVNKILLASQFIEAGINLQIANNILILTLSDEMNAIIQLPGRLHRVNSEKDVVAIQCITRGTLEHHKFNKFLRGRLVDHHFILDGICLKKFDIEEEIKSQKIDISQLPDVVKSILEDFSSCKVLKFTKYILGYEYD